MKAYEWPAVTYGFLVGAVGSPWDMAFQKIHATGAPRRSEPTREVLRRTAARRVPLAFVLAGGLLLATPQLAGASCSAPVLAEQIQRADLIASGVVTAVGLGGAGPITFRPTVIYRGTLAAGPVSVRIGPRPQAAPNPGFTAHSSVDYTPEAGTTQTLYLRRTGSALDTNACSGSHPGLASGAETSTLGPGQALATDTGPLAQLFDQLATLPLLLYLGVTVIFIFIFVVLRTRRGPPMTPLSGAPA